MKIKTREEYESEHERWFLLSEQRSRLREELDTWTSDDLQRHKELSKALGELNDLLVEWEAKNYTS